MEEVLARYRQLVDKRYLTGLSEAENAELVQLGDRIDAVEAPFYDRIIEKLSGS